MNYIENLQTKINAINDLVEKNIITKREGQKCIKILKEYADTRKKYKTKSVYEAGDIIWETNEIKVEYMGYYNIYNVFTRKDAGYRLKLIIQNTQSTMSILHPNMEIRMAVFINGFLINKTNLNSWVEPLLPEEKKTFTIDLDIENLKDANAYPFDEDEIIEAEITYKLFATNLYDFRDNPVKNRKFSLKPFEIKDV